MHYSSQGRAEGLQSDPDGEQTYSGHCYCMASLKAAGSLSAGHQDGLMSFPTCIPEPSVGLFFSSSDATVSVRRERWQALLPGEPKHL